MASFGINDFTAFNSRKKKFAFFREYARRNKINPMPREENMYVGAHTHGF